MIADMSSRAPRSKRKAATRKKPNITSLRKQWETASMESLRASIVKDEADRRLAKAESKLVEALQQQTFAF